VSSDKSEEKYDILYRREIRLAGQKKYCLPGDENDDR
jgi:hypothetical protein